MAPPAPAGGNVGSPLANLARRANPQSCLKRSRGDVDDASTMVADREALDVVLPALIASLRRGDAEEASSSLRRVYELSDAAHKHNRIPMVCSTKYDIVDALATCLVVNENNVKGDARTKRDGSALDFDEAKKTGDTYSRVGSEGIHVACLSLNNLSIPFENKAVMSLGPSAHKLLSGLTRVIREQRTESYLCCVCLMNISFLEDAVTPILYYSPRARVNGDILTSSSSSSPLDDPESLLRVLEHVLSRYPRKPTTHVSVEGETIRWICGLLRNLSRVEQCANLLSQTKIPERLVGYLKAAPKKLTEWTMDSLEESALSTVCNLSRFSSCRPVLIRSGALEAVEPVAGKGGIHALRATMVRSCLLQQEHPGQNASNI